MIEKYDFAILQMNWSEQSLLQSLFLTYLSEKCTMHRAISVTCLSLVFLMCELLV